MQAYSFYKYQLLKEYTSRKLSLVSAGNEILMAHGAEQIINLSGTGWHI